MQLALAEATTVVMNPGVRGGGTDRQEGMEGARENGSHGTGQFIKVSYPS